MGQYYGVWIGRNPGIYEKWDDCKKQIDKFPSAKFRKLKSSTYDNAVKEFNAESSTSLSPQNNLINEKVGSVLTLNNANVPENDVLTVDGASNGKNCEFRAVWYPNKKEVFASKIYDGGTNNIAEFLGLVFALKYLIENNLPLRIYSDSVTAIAWYRNMKANTTANQTGKGTLELNTLIKNAEQFLKDNQKVLSNAMIMKWDTKNWGEIAADYGRK